MSSQEFVEDYVKKIKTKLVKFLISMVAIDIVAMTIVYLVFIKLVNIENDVSLYIFAAVLLIVVYFSIYISAKLNFGSFRKFIKESNMFDAYKAVLKQYEKTHDKEAFNKSISALEIKIRKQ